MATIPSHRVLLDLYARLSIMEGIAGEDPKTWTGRGDVANLMLGIALAQKALPGLHATWFSLSKTPLIDAMQKAAIAKGASPEDVEDTLSDVLGGLSRPPNIVGGELYNIGTLPRSTSLAFAANCLSFHTYHRVGAASRKVRNIPSDFCLPQVKSVADRAVDFWGSPEWKEWMTSLVIKEFATSPSKLQVILTWLEDTDQTSAEIAAKLGKQGYSGYALFNLQRKYPKMKMEEPEGWKDEHGGFTYVAYCVRAGKAVMEKAILKGNMPESLKMLELMSSI